MTALNKEQRRRLAQLQGEVNDGRELIERYNRGHTNFDAAYCNKKLADAQVAFDEYMDSITKGDKMDDAYEPPSGNDSFKLKASVQTYELSIADLATLVSLQLGVPESRITITDRQKDVSGYMDRDSRYEFDGLTITVKN